MNKIFCALYCVLIFTFGIVAAQDPQNHFQNLFSNELVKIPSGTFQMGSIDGDRDERPVRTVNVSAFEMSRSEVTLAWYMRCMADGVCGAPSWWVIGYFEEVPSDLSAADRANLPVTGISWREAKQFCQWLGTDYDLPSEAEWEYAASAGKNWKYPWGNDADDRYHGMKAPKYLSPVMSQASNPFGVYDMGGVWEWVNDCYDAKSDGSCISRTTKGGSWSEHIWNLRVANKSYGLEKEGYKGLGFRVVRHEK